MELGATVCLPRNPLCLLCPIESRCRARREGTTARLPVKRPPKERVRIEGVLLIVRRGRGSHQQVLLRQRDAGERRMAGFWELPVPEDLPGARIGAVLGEIRHTITYHHYTWKVRAAGAVKNPGPAFRWFAPSACAEMPLSTSARKALRLSGIL
jgi:A/G-specific adenine glycosylase